jgi:imidazolonepropionase-like amidohydrolase
MAINRREFEIASKNLKKMSAAGVRIGFGTDTGHGNPRYEGFFEHLEMQLMVEPGGMTPMQVIQAYSKTNSEAFGVDKEYGTLAKGKAADLVVLDKSPLDSILNTRSINTVYLAGKKYE